MAEGDLRWRYDAGKAIHSGIVVGSDGVIYFATDWVAGSAKIIALNSDGSLKWEFTHAMLGEMLSGLVLTNDESVLYTGQDSTAYVWAINTVDGSLKWNYNDILLMACHSGPDIDNNDNLYFGDVAVWSVSPAGAFRWKSLDLGQIWNQIKVLDATSLYTVAGNGCYKIKLSDGSVIWSHPTGANSAGSGISIADDGSIYSCGDVGVNQYFRALNNDGSLKWSYGPLLNGAFTANAIGSNGNIWFVDRDDPSIVIVLKPDMTFVWGYALPSWCGSGFDTTGLALDSNDFAYLGCADSKLHVLNSDGTFRWSYTTGGIVRSGIAFSPAEDTVFFGSDDGYLYAIEIGAPPPPAKGGASALLLFAKMLMG